MLIFFKGYLQTTQVGKELNINLQTIIVCISCISVAYVYVSMFLCQIFLSLEHLCNLISLLFFMIFHLSSTYQFKTLDKDKTLDGDKQKILLTYHSWFI